MTPADEFNQFPNKQVAEFKPQEDSEGSEYWETRIHLADPICIH